MARFNSRIAAFLRTRSHRRGETLIVLERALRSLFGEVSRRSLRDRLTSTSANRRPLAQPCGVSASVPAKKQLATRITN
jgi:hypothetical protein